MTKLDPKISVNMLSQEAGFLAPLYQMAENYTSGNKQAFATHIEGSKCTVKVVTFPEQTPSWWVQATRWTGIVPAIMEKIKEYHHRQYEFVQDGHPVSFAEKSWIVIRQHQTVKVMDDSTIRQKYAQLFQKASITNPTAMQNHVVFFADENCRITAASIQNGLERLGKSNISAIGQSHLIFYGLANAEERKAGYITMQGINSKCHKMDSGIFTNTGSIDQHTLDKVKRTAHTSPDYFTTQDMEVLHRIADKRDHTASFFTRLSGLLASRKEFKGLFDFCGKEAYVVKSDKRVLSAVPFTIFEEFYRTGYITFERLAAGVAPKEKKE